MNKSTAVQVIRRFVAGEAAWSDLSDAGVEIEIGGANVLVRSDASTPNVSVRADEIAHGFLKRQAGGDLQEWAGVLLASAFIDLSALETDREGERILEGIWDAAAGRPVAPAMQAVVQKVSRTP